MSAQQQEMGGRAPEWRGNGGGESHQSWHTFRRRQGNAVVGGTLGVVMHDEYRVRDVPQPRGEDGTASAGWLTERRRLVA
jgi:hypothetical protein